MSIQRKTVLEIFYTILLEIWCLIGIEKYWCDLSNFIINFFCQCTCRNKLSSLKLISCFNIYPKANKDKSHQQWWPNGARGKGQCWIAMRAGNGNEWRRTTETAQWNADSNGAKATPFHHPSHTSIRKEFHDSLSATPPLRHSATLPLSHGLIDFLAPAPPKWVPHPPQQPTQHPLPRPFQFCLAFICWASVFQDFCWFKSVCIKCG